MSAPHVTIGKGLDHVSERCPSLKAERRQYPEAPLFVGEVDCWDPEPPETLPFGLCTWCYRLHCRRMGRVVPERLWHGGFRR